jgi:hypothetical protein
VAGRGRWSATCYDDRAVRNMCADATSYRTIFAVNIRGIQKA